MAYAKIENGVVTELLDDADLTPVEKCEYPNCSHPVSVGWFFDGTAFTPPPPPPEETPPETPPSE